MIPAVQRVLLDERIVLLPTGWILVLAVGGALDLPVMRQRFVTLGHFQVSQTCVGVLRLHGRRDLLRGPLREARHVAYVSRSQRVGQNLKLAREPKQESFLRSSIKLFCQRKAVGDVIG